MEQTIKLHPSWLKEIGPVFETDALKGLKAFLAAEKARGAVIFPKGAQFFRALDLTPFDQVRVVILGQDPYHGDGQAEGLCFSVPKGIKPPPSLVNIFKELKADLGIAPPSHGHLGAWAGQGVLLLNAVLSVERSLAASHAGKGWEQLTDAIIRAVAARAEPCVFILWGNYAQKKAAFVDETRHVVIKSAHPSPLSAHNGFFGSKPFGRANEALTRFGYPPIDWRLGE